MAIKLWVESYTVAHRPLNSTTTVNDQSGNNYNLTQTGGSFTTYNGVDSFYNGGSGVTGYLTLTDASNIPSGNADRTILLWAGPRQYNRTYSRFIFGYGSPNFIRLSINTSGKAAATVRYGTNSFVITSTNNFDLSNWSLLTFTSSGNTFNFYMNGSLVGSNSSGTIDTSGVSSTAPLRLMISDGSTSSNYQTNGYLSEVKIENIMWSQAEITDYYNNNKSKYGL